MKHTDEHSGIPEQLENRVLKLNIVLNHKRKDFRYNFEGEWRGRDVKTVTNHLFREYRKHLQTIRRTTTPTKPEVAVTDERKDDFTAVTGQPKIAVTYTDRDETPPLEEKTIEAPSKQRGRRKKEDKLEESING